MHGLNGRCGLCRLPYPEVKTGAMAPDEAYSLADLAGRLSCRYDGVGVGWCAPSHMTHRTQAAPIYV